MYTITGRVGASQTGADGKMKLASALDMIQDCSMFWMESEPYFNDFMRDNNLAMFLQFRQLDVLRLPCFGETLTATTSIFACQSFYGHRNTMLYGADGTPCVQTWSLGVFVSMDTGRMARLPQGIETHIALDEKADMDYLDRRIRLPKTEAAACPPYTVRRGDIDKHRHMNNARYLDAALELLPEGFVPRRIRVDYKLPATLGDVLYPTLAAEGDALFLTLNNAGGKPCAVLEFRP